MSRTSSFINAPSLIRNGLLSDIQSSVYDEDNVPCILKGGYHIVDGGFTEYRWLSASKSTSVFV